jgi:polysaccharide export outer membrane protein
LAQVPETVLAAPVEASSAVAGAISGTSIAETLIATPADAPAAAYRLGANDEVIVRVLDAEEIPEQPLRIDSRGFLNLPLAGRVVAAGRSVEELEAEIAARLGRYLHEPQVTVTLGAVRSQPVAVLGAVNRPGVQQIDSALTLVEMLSLAGGLREDAGHTIKITRRAEFGPLPLAGARAAASGRFSVAEVNVKEVLEARRPEDNIAIRPHDVISVPRAEMVYVIGEVEKSGGFVLEERQSVSVLQALSLAGGLTDVAAIAHSKILRGGGGEGERVEIAVDLKAIMAGKSPDVALEREDILFVPRSGRRAAGQAVKKAAVGTLSGIAIWRIGAQ